jgi:hypothetical protein
MGERNSVSILFPVAVRERRRLQFLGDVIAACHLNNGNCSPGALRPGLEPASSVSHSSAAPGRADLRGRRRLLDPRRLTPSSLFRA